MKITPELLRAAVGCTSNAAQFFAQSFDDACRAYAINTPDRLAAFLAQVGHESRSFRYVREVWGPTPAQQRYEGREDLGNTQPGDGVRYMGRGLIQTTGRANYCAVRDRLRARGLADVPDFEANPEALEALPWAVLSAADYWGMRGLNTLADDDQFETITRRINGGLNGQADRLERWVAARNAIAKFGAQAPEAPAAPPAKATTTTMKTKDGTMGPFLLPAISALIDIAPKLGKLFGSGSEVSERNVKAAELVAEIAKGAIGATNEQELVDRIKTDPGAAQAVREAIEREWYRLDEIGGGIAAARASNVQQSTIDPKRNMALWVTLLLLPLVYLVVGAVVFSSKDAFSQDVKAMVVAAVISGVLGAITGYWLGTSFSSAKKDEQRAAPAAP